LELEKYSTFTDAWIWLYRERCQMMWPAMLGNDWIYFWNNKKKKKQLINGREVWFIRCGIYKSFLIQLIQFKAMFVSRNSLFGKLLSKLSCVCLPLKKLVNKKHFPVNGEHFPVNGEHFPVNGKHFPVNEKFGLVSRKVFSLWLCLFSGKWFPGNHFPNFPVFVCH